MYGRLRKCLKYTAILILISMMMSACSYLPSPDEVMRPPMGEEKNALNINTDRFIPNDMVMLTAANSGGRYKIRFTDIENDENEEVVIFYGYQDDLACRGFVILRKYNDWFLYHRQSYAEDDSYIVENVEFLDIDGNGRREMIEELSTFSNARVFKISKFNPNIEKQFMFSAGKMEIIRREKEVPMLAVWEYKESDGVDINIIQWDDDGFVNATYDAPGYYLKLISLYENSDSEVKNLNLADVLLKAGDYENGLGTIEEFLEGNHENEQVLRAEIIKARCLYNLGRSGEARKVLSNVELVYGYNVDKMFEAFLLMVDILVDRELLDAAREVLAGSQKLLYNYLEIDYKLHLWETEYEKRVNALEGEQ